MALRNVGDFTVEPFRALLVRLMPVNALNCLQMSVMLRPVVRKTGLLLAEEYRASLLAAHTF